MGCRGQFITLHFFHFFLFTPSPCSNMRSRHSIQSFMNFCNMCLSHELQFFKNCPVGLPRTTCLARNPDPVWGPLHRLQLLQRACSNMGYSQATSFPQGTSTCFTVGSFIGCRAATCLTTIFTMESRGISAPVPEALPLAFFHWPWCLRSCFSVFCCSCLSELLCSFFTLSWIRYQQDAISATDGLSFGQR